MESCGPCILWTEAIVDGENTERGELTKFGRVSCRVSGVRGGLANGAGPSSGALGKCFSQGQTS